MSKSDIQVRSFAKINLVLKVLDRRPDGYHNILTQFQSIGLYDLLSITATGTGALRLSCNHPAIPLDDTNLVVKAALMFLEESGWQTGLDIVLDKRIPVAAGLGGGSSNAAATLSALNRLAPVSLTETRLHELALRIGSDVPYFLMGGRALGEGRGEKLKQLSDLEKFALLLIFPNISIRASAAYRNFDLTSEARFSDINDQIIDSRNADGQPVWSNDLERGVFAEHPELADLKRLLIEHGAEQAIMSGSGSTVVGSFKDEESAGCVAKKFRNGEFDVIVTRSISASEYRRRFVIDGDETA